MPEEKATEKASCPVAEPVEEHRWLNRLAGAWRFEGGATAQGDRPAEAFSGTETVRILGGLWAVAEGRSEMPEGEAMSTVMLLGFDPARNAYVGSFACSVMTHLWIYRGRTDGDGKRLVLATEGPSMEEGGGSTAFEDFIGLEDADHRTLTSRMRTNDGQWREVFSARYTRLPD